ncbi:MAG: MFS transporter [Patescibacteria group bacterium]
MKSLLLRIKFSSSPLWVIFEISFFRNLAAASLTAILPLYFKQFVHSDAAVGMIFFIGYLASFTSNIYSAHIIQHLKKRKSLLLALIIFTALFGIFAMAKHTAVVLLGFAVYQFILSLFVLDVSLYIKHYSNFRQLAQNEGKLGSFSNIGWVVGPLLGSLIADAYGFEAVFIFSAAVALIALITFFFIRLDNEEVKLAHARSLAQNIQRFFRDPNMRKTYINNAGLGFIYTMWDFLPLLMTGIGATIPIIGLTKTLMGVSQSIFEYPIGQLADRQTGERKIFIVGYFLAALFTIFMGLTTDLRTFIIFFFVAATGTSFLEMTRDAYFFRQMPEKEVELVSVYRTSDTFPNLVGQAMAIGVLLFLPVHWLFIIGGSLAFVIFVSNAYALKELKNPV